MQWQTSNKSELHSVLYLWCCNLLATNSTFLFKVTEKPAQLVMHFDNEVEANALCGFRWKTSMAFESFLLFSMPNIRNCIDFQIKSKWIAQTIKYCINSFQIFQRLKYLLIKQITSSILMPLRLHCTTRIQFLKWFYTWMLTELQSNSVAIMFYFWFFKWNDSGDRHQISSTYIQWEFFKYICSKILCKNTSTETWNNLKTLNERFGQWKMKYF